MRAVEAEKYEYDFHALWTSSPDPHQMNHISGHNTRIIQKKLREKLAIHGATSRRGLTLRNGDLLRNQGFRRVHFVVGM